MKKALFRLVAAAASIALCSSASAIVFSLTDYTSFGGDGWLANGESSFLANDGLARGIAYDASNNALLLASRTTGNNIRTLNGATGSDSGSNFNLTGVAGGNNLINMIGVADDGAVYVGNLVTNSVASPFKVYRWSSATAAISNAPTVAFSGAPLTGLISGVNSGARLGDTLDVTGSGANTKLVAGYSTSTAITGINTYSLLSTADGSNFTGAHISIPGSPPANGDFRLGITFGANDTTVMGTQSAGAANGFRLTTYAGSTGTLVDSSTLTAGNERAMDYAVVNGVPLLATLDTGSSAAPNSGTGLVRVYDMTDPNNPVLVATKRNSTMTDALLNANGNATGQVKFGAIGPASAIIYALGSNNGIQAFTLSVAIPEASSFAAVGLAGLIAVGAAVVRKRR